MKGPSRRTGFAALTFATIACDRGPRPPFVLVELDHALVDSRIFGGDLPVGDPSFATCEATDWTDGLPEDATVSVPSFDAWSSDYAAIEDALLAHWQYASVEDEWFYGQYCLGWPYPEPVASPFICDPSTDSSRILDPELKAHVCDPRWISCFSAMEYYYYSLSGTEDSVSFFSWSVDSLVQPPWKDVLDDCHCGASLEDVMRVDDMLSNSYDRWSRRNDASVVVHNAANTWRAEPAEATVDRNAGVCGVWLYGDAAWADLNQRTCSLCTPCRSSSNRVTLSQPQGAADAHRHSRRRR